MHHPFPNRRTYRATPRSERTRRPRSLIAQLVAFVVAASVLTPLATPPADAQGAANFVFHGAGWGHGVGMSQNGARNMADQGYDHVAILAQYYPNTAILPTAPLGDIRVHVGDASRVEFTSAGQMTFEQGGTVLNGLGSGGIQVSAHDGGLQIGSVWATATPSNPVMLTFPQPVKISNNGHRYLWGKMQLTNRKGKVRVVEVLPLEDYVLGISEMPAAWPLEALMAQAIAARTYAHEVTLHRRASAEWGQEYDISGTTVDQNYIGWDAQDGPWDAKWTAAVKATASVEIVDSGGPVRAYYSASNGGWTESAAYVFGNEVTHTEAAPDPFDAGGHNWSEWTRTYSQAAMSRWLGAHADTSVGTLTAINVLGGEGPSGRLDKATVELVGTQGTKRVTGKRLMIVMNAGIFGQGLGLDDHLPGTYTTIGNGASAGFPQATGQAQAPQVTPDPAPADASSDFTPPPGWKPDPGTGIDPIRTTTGSATDTAVNEAPADTPNFVPPPGWKPDPATAVDPIVGTATPSNAAPSNATPSNATTTDADDTAAATDPAGTTGTAGFTPPEGWTPEPGTGVAPLRLNPGSAGSEGSDTDTEASDSTFVPPEGWTPEPGRGVDPTTGDDTVGGTGGGDASRFVPPPGWKPEPGTGVAPIVAAHSAGSLASAVLLVTRTENVDVTPAQFRVIAPTEALADEARTRLERLQTQAAAALFADFDIDGYVAAVAPRPVHGVCTATDDGITCISLQALEAAQD